MHPALRSWRNDLSPNIVRLLAYLGAIALLSMAGAHSSKSPKVMGAITPVHQGWIDIERPFAAVVVPVRQISAQDRFTSQENATSTPITEMVVNSLITSHRDGAKINPGKVTVSGIAWDGGYGVSAVQVSTDGGKTWTSATLRQDLRRFAFHPWTFDFTAKKGKNTVMVNAINKLGQSQGVVGCRDHDDNQGLWRPIDDTDAKAIAEYLKKNYGS